MEIPGLSPFSGQPTVTNPLSSENHLVGRQSTALRGSEAAGTTTVQEQQPTSLQTTGVVSQAESSQAGGFNPENPGGTIDITV